MPKRKRKNVAPLLHIRYTTKERIYKNELCYSNVSADAELIPVMLIRQAIGGASARKRYHYQAKFHAPGNTDDSASYKGMLITNINRKSNPHFKPTDFVWISDCCYFQSP